MIIKKIVSGVLALAMFTTVITVPMLSSAADAVTVSGEHDTAKAGGTFALDFSLTNVPKEGISGWEFSIKYDSSVLTVDSLEAGAAITSTRATAGETELVPGFGGEGYMVGNGSTYDTFDYNIISGGEITAMWATGLNDSKYWIDEAGVVFTLNGTVSDKAELGKDYIFEIQAIDREGNNEMMFCYYADNKDNFYDSSVAQDGKLTIVKDPDISTPSETVTTLTTSEPTGTTPSETVTTLTTSEPTGTTPSETVTTLTTSEPTGTTSSETVTTLTTSEPTGTTSSETVTTLTTSEPTGTTPSETVTSPTTSEPTGTTPSETVTTVTTTEPTGTSTSETTTSGDPQQTTVSYKVEFKYQAPDEKYYYSYETDFVMEGMRVIADIIKNVIYSDGTITSEVLTSVDVTADCVISSNPHDVYWSQETKKFEFDVPVIYTYNSENDFEGLLADYNGETLGTAKAWIGQRGDANMDHLVRVNDASVVLQYDAETVFGFEHTVLKTNFALFLANTHGDSDIKTDDAAKIADCDAYATVNGIPDSKMDSYWIS